MRSLLLSLVLSSFISSIDIQKCTKGETWVKWGLGLYSVCHVWCVKCYPTEEDVDQLLSYTVHSQKCALIHCFSFHLNNLESDSTSRTTICSWFQCPGKSSDTFPDTAVDHLCLMKQHWPLFLHGVNLHRASFAGNSYSLCALFKFGK